MSIRTSSSTFVSLFVTLLLAFLTSSASADQCHLCANPGDSPQLDKWEYQFSNGQTCADIYYQLSKIMSWEDTCSTAKTMAQATCCNAGFVAAPCTAVAAPVIPVYKGRVGTEPSCPICRTMEYPSKPYEFIFARYVGEFSCSDLYGRGLHGMIDVTMCGPLQDYAHAICGCGIYRTDDCSSGTSLTAAPQSAPQSTVSLQSANTGNRNLRGAVAGGATATAAATQEEEASIPTLRQLTAEDMHFSTRPLVDPSETMAQAEE